ncbi:MAG: proteasome activator [Acidimicrobiia bacterium]
MSYLIPISEQPGSVDAMSHARRFDRLFRVAAVANAMLEEVRDAPCDPPGCGRLRDSYLRTVDELRDVLGGDLRDELGRRVVAFGRGAPTPSELRVAHAELVGWLDGLLGGLAAAVDTIEAPSVRDEEDRADIMPGQYL